MPAEADVGRAPKTEQPNKADDGIPPQRKGEGRGSSRLDLFQSHAHGNRKKGREKKAVGARTKAKRTRNEAPAKPGSLAV